MMIDTVSMSQRFQPDNWLYEIKQKGQTDACYVMVPKVSVGGDCFNTFINL